MANLFNNSFLSKSSNSVLGIVFSFFLVPLFAFYGIVSYIFYFIGFLFKGFYYPITLISQTIYPVGAFVYSFYTGIVVYFIVRLIIKFIIPLK